MIETFIESGKKYRKKVLPSGSFIIEYIGDPSLPDDYIPLFPEIEPISPEQQRIETLEAENITLKLALADLAETQEAEKLATQLALAELAEMIAGGE